MTEYRPAPTQTWRLCHPVNIYVYKNGVGSMKPQLVHIPMEKKKNMETALEEIGNRLKLVVGYPIALYNMDGTRVCKTYELEMYNNYVVVTNLEKRFRCAEYGKVREPLVVIGSYSKHVNTLKFQNKKYDLFCRKKMTRKPLHEMISHEQDGFGPSEIPATGKPCGALCHKILPSRNRPTQCCSDEIMCVEGAAMSVEPDACREQMEAGCNFDEMQMDSNFKAPQAPNGSPCPVTQESDLDELARLVRSEINKGQTPCGNLADLIQRYKEVGSGIFKMFQDKINQDMNSQMSSRWDLPSNMSMATQEKLKDDLTRITQLPCEFNFDQAGNFVCSSTCRVGPPAGVFSGLKEMMEQQCENGSEGCDIPEPRQRNSNEGNQNFQMPRTSFSEEPRQRNSNGGNQNFQMPRTSFSEEPRQRYSNGGNENSQMPLTSYNAEIDKTLEETVQITNAIEQLNQRRLSGMSHGSGKSNKSGSIRQPKLPNIAEIDEENNVSPEEFEPPSNRSGSKDQGATSSKRPSNVSRTSNGDGFGEPSSANDVNEIIGQMKEIIMSRDGQGSGLEIPGTFENYITTTPVESLTENGRLNDSRSGSLEGDQELDEDGKAATQIYTLMYEQSRNPFLDGSLQNHGGQKHVQSLVGKLNDNRMEKLFAQNPFIKSPYFKKEYNMDDHILPPEGYANANKAASHIPEFSYYTDVNNNTNFSVPPRNLAPPDINQNFTDQRHSLRSNQYPFVAEKSSERKYSHEFLSQINELVHRHDRTKSTSPPPPSPPRFTDTQLESASTATFIVERKRLPDEETGKWRGGHLVTCKDQACGISTTDIFAAQNVLYGRSGLPIPNASDLSARSKEGATQTHQLLTDGEGGSPAGIYEGYQESIKVKTSDLSSTESSDEYYRKLRRRKKRNIDNECKQGLKQSPRHRPKQLRKSPRDTKVLFDGKNCNTKERGATKYATMNPGVYTNPQNQTNLGPLSIVNMNNLQGFPTTNTIITPRGSPNSGYVTNAINASSGLPLQQSQLAPQYQLQQPVVQRVIVSHPGSTATTNLFLANPQGAFITSNNKPLGQTQHQIQGQPFIMQAAPTARSAFPILTGSSAPSPGVLTNFRPHMQMSSPARMNYMGNVTYKYVQQKGQHQVMSIPGNKVTPAPNSYFIPDQSNLTTPFGGSIVGAPQQQNRFAAVPPNTAVMNGMGFMRVPVSTNGSAPIMTTMGNTHGLLMNPLQGVYNTMQTGTMAGMRPIQLQQRTILPTNMNGLLNTNNALANRNNKYIQFSPYALCNPLVRQ